MQNTYRRYRLLWRRKYRKFSRTFEHHPYVMPVATFLMLFSIAVVLFVTIGSRTTGASDAHNVILWHDKKSEVIPTRTKTVGDFLEKMSVILNEGDVVEPATSTQILDDNFRINVYRARPVAVVDGGHKIYTLSAASTPRSIAKQAGVEVFPEDTLDSKQTEDFVKEGTIGQQVVIDRATPASINLYGSFVTVRTHAKTVRDLLKEKNVNLATDDSVQPTLDTPLTPSTQVFVIRNGSQIATVEEPIGMPTETVEDAGLSFGTTAIRQQGSPGKKLVTYQVVLKNGKEVSRQKIQEVIAEEPVKQIVARGKAVSIPSDKEALMASAGISSGDFAYVNYIISRESGWCPTKWQGQVGICPGYYTQLHPIDSAYGYGLCQSTPAGKMASAGSDWTTNPVTQLKWCSGYAIGRYGSWGAAYNRWVNYHNW